MHNNIDKHINGKPAQNISNVQYIRFIVNYAQPIQLWSSISRRLFCT